MSAIDSLAVAGDRPVSGARLLTPVAFVLLMGFALAARLGGFPLVHRLVRRCPTLGKPSRDVAAAKAVATAVDRASRFVLKRAWCLQRSSAAVALLRLAGYPAKLVIAVRKIPFYAHAWAELEGVVLNDSPAVQERYSVIETC